MSILDNIRDKAKDLLNIAEPFTTRNTKGYDASKNSIIVAGIVLDGVVSSTISSDIITRQEMGIDYCYSTYYEVITPRTLSVTILPTAKCLDTLRLLALRQLESKGWFNITVNENDNIVNVYRGFITDLPEIGMSQEASDRIVTFAIKPMHSGVSVIDQSTQTEDEVYSRTGARPDLGGANKNTTINESSGGLVDVPYEPLPQDPPEQPFPE